MKRSRHISGNSLSIALFFVALTILLIVGGILLKLFLLWKTSSFDGVHQYIIEVHNPQLTKGEFLIFSPDIQSITAITVQGRVDATFARYLALPTDATVVDVPSDNITNLLQGMLFIKKDETTPTELDIIRLLLFADSVNAANFSHQSLMLPIDAKTSEIVLPNLFLDKDLYAENESVTVENATNISGLGNKVAHMLTSIGINVVSVTTANTNENASVLSTMRMHTYTISRMSHLLGLPITASNKQTLSDITLIVGKDLLSRVQ